MANGPDADHADLAKRIYERVHLTGDFRLRSGAVATEYFDKYLFESDPHLLAEIAARLAPMVPHGAGALAGLELGGVPLSTALSRETGLPTVFVRKQAKDYGTQRIAEGLPSIEGCELVIVEDVVTSGGQVAESCRELRQLGARVSVAVCVIDREAGGAEMLQEAGVELRPLFTMSRLQVAITSR